jgi:hypothetical protein
MALSARSRSTPTGRSPPCSWPAASASPHSSA